MDGWKSWKPRDNSFITNWYQRVRESYVAVWFFGMFQSGRMSTASNSGIGGGGSSGGGGGGGGGSGGSVSGALSLMGCVREASPPPQNHHHYHHYHHNQQQQQQQQQQGRGLGIGDFSSNSSVDPLPKEPKKRRFHPLRGLRKIFRRKSRGAADVRLVSSPGTGGNGERDGAELVRIPREEVTLRHPAGRAEEARSRSASELLTDSCDRESVFLRRNGTEDLFVKLRGGTGKLSVSHDSVFPGEVPHTRPLSSLDSLPALERRQERKSNEIEHKDYAPYVVQRHRISLRVLEQIKTVIENRNQQQASAISSDNSNNALQQTAGERYQQETTENRFGNCDSPDKGIVDESHVKVTNPAKENVERTVSTVKEDLPQFESASLNHTAALHRISVRPKNRRPPRRAPSTTNNASTLTTITTIIEDTMDDADQPKSPTNIISSSPTESKKSITSVTRKSSARKSRSSDIFESLESPQFQQQQQQQQQQQPQPQPQPRLPRKPSSTASLSPDSLDAPNASRTSLETNDEQVEIRSVARRPSNRISKGSDVFEELESKLPRRRSSSSRLSKSPDSLETTSCWFSKSTEGFENLIEYEESKPVAKRLLNPISKSSDRISKSSDSLEAIEALTSDDSIERRRSSFEFRPRKSSKSISKSSESFEVLDQSSHGSDIVQELQKRSSISDMNLSRGRRLSKSTSKSSESFERIDVSDSKNVELDEKEEVKEKEENEQEEEEEEKITRRRSSKRMSSESSDNLDVEDRLENRRVRRIPKRVSSTSIVDIIPMDDNEEERRSIRKSRLQKSSESSELGSTDTLDSERRNKSSESTETLDSLEKDVEQDRKEMEITDNVLDRRDKNDSWSSRSMTTTDSEQTSMADGTEDSKSLISPDKFYWRQSESKENLDIHQLLAITIVTRMADNGNNQRSPVIYPKKKQQTSPPTSPVAKQEDNKMIFDNLLTNKNDEDLQNMLNGNISEVSTDTKSFKEKLIMFEKLGK